MENILNLKTYNKYLNLIKEGLILLPDNTLTNLIDDVHHAYRDKPLMAQGETHDVVLKAGKKVRITSRGSLRNIEIDGITYNSIEQAACSIYDSYDEYFNEMTGFPEVIYKRVINLIDELTQDLHLKTGLVKIEEKISTNNWSFQLPEDLDEEKKNYLFTSNCLS